MSYSFSITTSMTVTNWKQLESNHLVITTVLNQFVDLLLESVSRLFWWVPKEFLNNRNH
jgi:hypothetical protein